MFHKTLTILTRVSLSPERPKTFSKNRPIVVKMRAPPKIYGKSLQNLAPKNS